MMLKGEHSADHNFSPYESPLTETATPSGLTHTSSVLEMFLTVFGYLAIALDSDCSNL